MSGDTDPYVYPGTNVLQNLLDIRDTQELARYEEEATHRRILELHENPIPGRFDKDHLQAIHRHIFQDVYPWAGEVRQVDMALPGKYYFSRPQRIEEYLDKTMQALHREDHLRNLNPGAFAERAGHYLGELYAAHPFREGNSRASREFIRQLGAEAGHRLDWKEMDVDRFREAAARSFEMGDNAGLEREILAALGHKSKDQDREAGRSREDHRAKASSTVQPGRTTTEEFEAFSKRLHDRDRVRDLDIEE